MGANDWMLRAEKAVPEVKATWMAGIYDCSRALHSTGPKKVQGKRGNVEVLPAGRHLGILAWKRLGSHSRCSWRLQGHVTQLSSEHNERGQTKRSRLYAVYDLETISTRHVLLEWQTCVFRPIRGHRPGNISNLSYLIT